MFKRNKNDKVTVLSDVMKKQQRYESLVRALHTDIYRYAYWLIGNKAIAEDVVQETFLRAWRSLDSLKDEKAAKSWLITILRRENARRFERKQFDLVDIDDVHVEDHSASLEASHTNDEVRKHISKLDEEYRDPLMLQVIFGFTGEEIAEQLSLNKNTVNTRLFRARSQLKESLEQPVLRGQANG
ncbi:sigma-70 family RNA polymerase sigma factor [Alteromonas sp. 5E99-2]|uniref:sigma-70 family RNA polymerase sigma factor n=1 Tax=Alteromonas sp. 5E99-2 TaxID=2817683 RepID=UPI001A99388C|nr:sigma-70 family RNA polymerase sigma factor [Alteromonas sp. 5E99-2]MBO1256078.1 sigma-70 family RNA polymerase sigma factor [Alteromonas sp. 5E99-2]